MKNAQQTIGNLIDKQKTVYVGSVDGAGCPNIKAMLAPRKRYGIKTFLFSTNTSSQRVAQFRANPNSCLYFCDRRFFRGVQLLGTMEVLEEREYKELIWQTGDTLYYAEGVTDPDYCVLRFTARSGRYYCNFKSEDFDIE